MKLLILLTLISAQCAALEMSQVEDINWRINGIEYRKDVDGYGYADYWATPSEMAENGFGDCEDFAISKYFALLDAGAGKTDLNIAYVTSRAGPHMVLLYTSNGADWVLDNASKYVRTLTSRTDLKEIYRFNGDAQFSKWTDVLKRMETI